MWDGGPDGGFYMLWLSSFGEAGEPARVRGFGVDGFGGRICKKSAREAMGD